eukprot:scaffold19037_cov63-Phaeocystis_antarctica.AAC.3
MSDCSVVLLQGATTTLVLMPTSLSKPRPVASISPAKKQTSLCTPTSAVTAAAASTAASRRPLRACLLSRMPNTPPCRGMSARGFPPVIAPVRTGTITTLSCLMAIPPSKWSSGSFVLSSPPCGADGTVAPSPCSTGSRGRGRVGALASRSAAACGAGAVCGAGWGCGPGGGSGWGGAGAAFPRASSVSVLSSTSSSCWRSARAVGAPAGARSEGAASAPTARPSRVSGVGGGGGGSAGWGAGAPHQSLPLLIPRPTGGAAGVTRAASLASSRSWARAVAACGRSARSASASAVYMTEGYAAAIEEMEAPCLSRPAALSCCSFLWWQERLSASKFVDVQSRPVYFWKRRARALLQLDHAWHVPCRDHVADVLPVRPVALVVARCGVLEDGRDLLRGACCHNPRAELKEHVLRRQEGLGVVTQARHAVEVVLGAPGVVAVVTGKPRLVKFVAVEDGVRRARSADEDGRDVARLDGLDYRNLQPFFGEVVAWVALEAVELDDVVAECSQGRR